MGASWLPKARREVGVKVRWWAGNWFVGGVTTCAKGTRDAWSHKIHLGFLFFGV